MGTLTIYFTFDNDSLLIQLLLVETYIHLKWKLNGADADDALPEQLRMLPRIVTGASMQLAAHHESGAIV